MQSNTRTANVETIGQRLKNLRTLMKRSLRDCATILSLSVEEYMHCESGEQQFTMPQIELLAFFLGVSTKTILYETRLTKLPSAYLADERRDKFLQLRNKLIASQIADFREKEKITRKELHEKTQIPLERLINYENGLIEIPIIDLINITQHLNRTIEDLFSVDLNPEFDTKPETSEFIKDPLSDTNPYDPEKQLYNDLIDGLRKIPKEDLAHIAKTILGILKSM